MIGRPPFGTAAVFVVGGIMLLGLVVSTFLINSAGGLFEAASVMGEGDDSDVLSALAPENFADVSDPAELESYRQAWEAARVAEAYREAAEQADEGPEYEEYTVEGLNLK